MPTSGRRESATEQLLGRLDHVRQLGRRRRLRVQLPLGALGLGICVCSISVAYQIRWTLVGALGAPAALWILLLCVMPGDERQVGAAVLVLVIVIALDLVARIGPFQSEPTRDALRDCDADVHPGGCRLFVACSGYAIGVLCVHALYTAYVGLGFLGTACRIRWLPSRSPRATLESTWRVVGSIFLSYAPFWLVMGIVELYEPANYFYLNEFYERLTIAEHHAARLTVCAEYVALGGLALWPGLRMFVQSRLSSCGEGVSTAAGLAAMLGSADTGTLLARARGTFRSVRCDSLSPHHLRSNEPAVDAFSLSTAATLGSIDAFVSHSWHDPPDEKWRLLQAWREQFVRAHGREPTLWLDRCCIDPSHLEELLPCLPIYLAGCDKLLALRGPTYLSRLWCCVELYVFFEMKTDASRIEIVDFADAPRYSVEGLELSRRGHGGGEPALDPETPSRKFPLAAPPLFSSRIECHSPKARRSRVLLTRESEGARPPPSVAAAPAKRLEKRASEHSLRWRGSAETKAAATHARFDVQEARCTMQRDADGLLAVIEACGAGFESFNAWMHDLLLAPATASDLGGKPARRTSRRGAARVVPTSSSRSQTELLMSVGAGAARCARGPSSGRR